MTRWRPTRAGILNVWRFHDETFTFHEGHLLLRGPNGSGKSTALELLLPHLLGAELPKNTQSILTNKDGISVGYVWLEFQRDSEWFTCGVRLQASASTTDVQASYFTTTRRVGDLLLTNETGHPLTRVNLARAIGQYGEVHGSPDGYRATLRTTLFQGMSDSLIASLATPTVDMLASLLPPLNAPEADLERVERQREKLQNLDDAVEVTETLISRHHAYVRQVHRDAEAQLKAATEHLAELSRTADETEQQYQEYKLTGSEQLEQEAANLDARLTGILSGERLDELTQRLAAARTRAEQAAKHAAALKARADEDTELAANAAAEATTKAEASEAKAAKARDAAQRAGVSPDDREADSRTRQIDQVRRALARHDNAVEARDSASARLEEERAELAQAETEETQAAQAHDAAREQLDDELAAWALRCRELLVVELTADREQLRAEVAEAAGRAREEFSRLESRLEDDRAALAGRLTQYATLREKLAGQFDVPPPAPYTREADRTRASGAPLWRLVEFRPHMPLNLCAAIEAALEASGLLDAWITPDDSPLDGDAFAEGAPPAPGGSLLDVLVPDGHAVYRVLEGIAFGESAPDHPAAVGADGTWRLGGLRGRWAKPAPTYIGATAREQATQRRVAELTTLIDDLQQNLDQLDEAKHRIAARRDALADELTALPHHDAVDETTTRLTGARVRKAVLRAAVTRTEQHRDLAETQVTQAVRELAEHDLPTTEHELDEVLDAVTAFRAAADQWRDERREARVAEHAAATAQDRAATSRQFAADAESTAAAQAQEVAELVAALGSGTDRDELDRLRARKQQIATELEELRRQRSALERLEEQREDEAAQREAAIAAKEAAEERLRRLGNGPGGEATDQDAEKQLTRAVEDARLVLSSRVMLSLEPGEDVTALTATLDRKPLSTTELLEWVRAQRDQLHKQVTSAERELIDQALTGDVVERIAERISAADELVDYLNPHLAAFGVRLSRQGADPEALDRFLRDRVDEVGWEQALDPIAWQRFVVQIDRGGWQPLTRRTRDALSGGEQALLRQVLAVAVVAAHYRATPTAPRLIPLDDAFAGLDTANRDRLLDLLVAFDLDLVLTSDQDWCDYRGLPGIAIHQLMRSRDAVTSVRFTWSGGS